MASRNFSSSWRDGGSEEEVPAAAGAAALGPLWTSCSAVDFALEEREESGTATDALADDDDAFVAAADGTGKG